MTRKNHLERKMVATNIIFIITVSIMALSVVYYWSFYHFANIFEDRVIDEYTFEKLGDMGVENEWILGVTTDSIDVVESIHKPIVAERIEERAHEQVEPTKLYKETIDGKHLLYQIDLDVKNGETIYKYSIIKDIYAEIFPQIVLSFIIFLLILFLISTWYTQEVSDQVYKSIKELRSYTNNITHGLPCKKLEIQTNDEEFQNLVNDLEQMNHTLQQEASIRQATLQYISHEMKTPIMIIEGYITSAKDGIYPTGDLEGTFDTILEQTARMNQKVQNLLTVVHLESTDEPDLCESIFIKEAIEHILNEFKYQLKTKSIHVDIPNDMNVYANIDKLNILFENLITNQCKYSESKLSITAFEDDTNIYMEFKNDGIPINETLKEHLFMPFAKGYNGSSGLGLSICKTIMTQMNGSIEFANNESLWIFKLTFPKAHTQDN